MIDSETNNGSVGGTSLGNDITDAGSRLNKEGQALSETLGKARETVTSEARELGSKAAEGIGAQAESVKDEAAAGLASFSEALKSASAELSGEKLGFAGDLVQQAASGLGSLARSLERSTPGEILDEMRSFGRQNPVGFLAGSVLAGFALGRVATAAATTGASSQAPQATSPATTARVTTPPVTTAPLASATPAASSTRPAGYADAPAPTPPHREFGNESALQPSREGAKT